MSEYCKPLLILNEMQKDSEIDLSPLTSRYVFIILNGTGIKTVLRQFGNFLSVKRQFWERQGEQNEG